MDKRKKGVDCFVENLFLIDRPFKKPVLRVNYNCSILAK